MARGGFSGACPAAKRALTSWKTPDILDTQEYIHILNISLYIYLYLLLYLLILTFIYILFIFNSLNLRFQIGRDRSLRCKHRHVVRPASAGAWGSRAAFRRAAASFTRPSVWALKCLKALKNSLNLFKKSKEKNDEKSSKRSQKWCKTLQNRGLGRRIRHLSHGPQAPDTFGREPKAKAKGPCASRKGAWPGKRSQSLRSHENVKEKNEKGKKELNVKRNRCKKKSIREMKRKEMISRRIKNSLHFWTWGRDRSRWALPWASASHQLRRPRPWPCWWERQRPAPPAAECRRAPRRGIWSAAKAPPLSRAPRTASCGQAQSDSLDRPHKEEIRDLRKVEKR